MATAAASVLRTQRRLTIGLREVLNFAYDAFCSNKLQFTLTSLAMAVGTASVILVVTIGLTGKQYILRQIALDRREHDLRRLSGRAAAHRFDS